MSKRLLPFVSCGWLLLAPAAALAQGGVDPFLEPARPRTPESGLSIGARLGYALPFGKLTADGDDLSQAIGGMLPMQVDLGWRFSPAVYVGGYFQYGVGFLASDMKSACDLNGLSCSASDLRFGVDFVYTFAGDGMLLPWIALGAGYEITKLTVAGSSGTADLTYKGWEFVHVGGGVDFRVAPVFRVGPFASFSLGQYGTVEAPGTTGATQSADITNKGLHEWLQLGLKGTFDF